MGAASLGAEDVGLRLLDAGATIEFGDVKGAFGETPLHWAATMGLDRLVGRMIELGADVNLKDAKYASAPLGWALHGFSDAPLERRRNFHKVVAKLIAAGAGVQPEWLASETVRTDPVMLAALRART
jgi:ankyrin repeat protein